jgi:hypothetical protein
MKQKITRFLRFTMKRWERRITITISKRQQFVILTLLLTFGMVLTQLVPADLRYTMVAGLSVLTFAATAFAMREDLSGIEWLTLLSLPTLFTAAVGLFYFLLPVRWLTRLPVAALYAVGIYALLLTENIYNVAAERTIALLRAAHSVGFLITLLTYFLLVQTILAFRLTYLANTISIGLTSFVLVLGSLWAVELGERLSRRVWQISIAISLILMELGWIFSFWPVATTLIALFLTTCFYSLVGMAQQYLVERLYKKTVVEFLGVVTIVFCIVFLATHWRGNI